MIKSMTGFGQGKNTIDGREYCVEIKTINHRYNDINIKMPRYLNFLEDKIRKYISSSLSRGKIDVYISLKNMSEKGREIVVDKLLAEKYINELRNIADELDLKDDLTAMSVMRIPDVFIVENENLEDLYWAELKGVLDDALTNINNSRLVEGKRLSEDIRNRLNLISNMLPTIEDASKNLMIEYKNKLENRIKELNANEIIDENRLGVEIVLFADKSSICEEITRLKSHIDSFKDMLEGDGPIGKKIDFLIQEMNRETNTIGSKANSIGITKYVIEMKNEIENIREQVQNIE